jgi:hypothetical protein
VHTEYANVLSRYDRVPHGCRCVCHARVKPSSSGLHVASVQTGRCIGRTISISQTGCSVAVLSEPHDTSARMMLQSLAAEPAFREQVARDVPSSSCTPRHQQSHMQTRCHHNGVDGVSHTDTIRQPVALPSSFSACAPHLKTKQGIAT